MNDLDIKVFDDENELAPLAQAIGWSMFLTECFGLGMDSRFVSEVILKNPRAKSLLVVVPGELSIEQIEHFSLVRYSADLKFQKDALARKTNLQRTHDIFLVTPENYKLARFFNFGSEREKIARCSRMQDKTYALWTPHRRESGLTESEKKEFDCEIDGMNYRERLLLGLYLWCMHKLALDSYCTCTCCGSVTDSGKTPTVQYHKGFGFRRIEFMRVNYLEKLPEHDKLLDVVRRIYVI